MTPDLLELVEYSFSNDSNKLKIIKVHDLGERQINLLESLSLGILEEFKWTIDNYAIIHTHNKHGQEKKEISRGQIPVVITDYLLIPEIVKEPDKISVGEKSNIGTELIIYEKDIDGVNYFYVEEVRKKRKSLAMKTLYKRKASTK